MEVAEPVEPAGDGDADDGGDESLGLLWLLEQLASPNMATASQAAPSPLMYPLGTATTS